MDKHILSGDPMLKEAYISVLKKKTILQEHRVMVNRDRGNDELAPNDRLFIDFTDLKKKFEKQYGKSSAEAHNRAFLSCDYERRFRDQIRDDERAMKKLAEIVKRSKAEDIYLVCFEGNSKACHRRILLRIAEEIFGAKVQVTGVEPV